MQNSTSIDEDLIPKETMTIGDIDHNQQLRTLAADKFELDYNLDVGPEELVVAERSGYLAVWVIAGAENAESLS